MSKDVVFQNRDKMLLEVNEYVEWLKSQAKGFQLSNQLVNEVFLNNDAVRNSLYYKIFDFNILETTKSEFVDFYIDHAYAKYLYSEIGKREYSKEIEAEVLSFRNLLREAEKDSITILVEYSKKNGWFDYEKALKLKQEIKEKAERDLGRTDYE